METEHIKERIEAFCPGCYCQVMEYGTPGTAHFRVAVQWQGFEGKTQLARHRLIMSLFDEYIESGDIHAFSLTLQTPEISGI